MTALYDTIGADYRRFRRPDPRIAGAIAAALDTASSVANIGAGSGSYEPRDRRVIAVEPSVTMIRQRPAAAAPVVQASATDLPLRDAAFDVSMAILTIHHWPDWRRGVQEMARVARQRVVILTWDPAAPRFWLTDEYFPEIIDIDRLILPAIHELQCELGSISVVAVPIPHDCADGFLGAYWRRPEAYLDSGVRGAISAFAKLHDVPARLERLREDLASGAWYRCHNALLSRDEIDLGYRLVVAAR